MSDDLKKYWAQRQQAAEQAPHYRPAHETQGIDVSKLNTPDYQKDFGVDSNGDRDISGMLARRLQQRAMQSQMQPHHASQGGAEVVDLREGMPFYISINDSFGTNTPIARQAGIIGGQSSKSVQIRKEVQCYLVESTGVVDIGKIQQSQTPKTFVEVSVPFVGNFLVAKETVIHRNAGPFGNGKMLLKG